jgi:hypothetical protein
MTEPHQNSVCFWDAVRIFLRGPSMSRLASTWPADVLPQRRQTVIIFVLSVAITPAYDIFADESVVN